MVVQVNVRALLDPDGWEKILRWKRQQDGGLR
jgi:hypothetical protein